MLAKKQNFLEKIVKRNYNNELEKLLEEKQFEENAKSTLLNILYKIETGYKDIETVKKDIETKEEYIENLMGIIKNNCNSIKILKMSEQNNQIPENRTYIIDKENKEIIAYPIERKVLYAIAKIGKKEKIIKDNYFLIDETISNLINTGNNIHMVEPLRDFNGYSWTTIPQEIESIDHNLIYQNLRILVGHKFLNKWIRSNEFMIDYFEEFKEELENKYGVEDKKKIIDLLAEISVLLEVKYNPQKTKEYTEQKEKLQEELEELENKEEYIEKVTNQKIILTEKIKKIDTIINNKELLEKEYKERNEKLPLEQKIFSIRILSQKMQKERDEYFKEIDKLNEILNPQNFVKHKKEIENKYKYLKVLDEKEKLEKLKLNFQKIFLKIMKKEISKAETKQDIEKKIYDFRYYMMIPYDNNILVQEKEELQKNIKETSELIISKANELKTIEKISNDKNTNDEILKNIFKVRIIKLEDAYLKITKEKEKYFVQIFDENIFEEKIEISKPKDLEIKLNKKIPIWIH